MSFHRAKFLPKGGPNGGDGGDGGNVIIVGDENVNDLSEYRFKPHANAENARAPDCCSCTSPTGKSSAEQAGSAYSLRRAARCSSRCPSVWL